MSQNKIIKAMKLNPTEAQRLQQAMHEDRSHLAEVMNGAVRLYLDYRTCGEFPEHKH